MTEDRNDRHEHDKAPGSTTRSWRQRMRFPRSWKDVKRAGWKAILAFVLFYLIRDSILYILLPYLAYEGVISL